MILNGSIVPLATPFDVAGQPDLARLAIHVARLCAGGSAALVVGGMAADASRMTPSALSAVISAVVDIAGPSMPVWAAVHANATAKAVTLAHAARAAGAKAVLASVPYYNKPSQAGILAHFQALTVETDMPVIVAHVPARTACDLTLESALRLATCPGVIGLMDGSSDLTRAAVLAAKLPAGFAFYSGHAPTALPFLLLGGHGLISAGANLTPELYSALCAMAADGDLKAARAVHLDLLEAHSALELETEGHVVQAGLGWQYPAALA